MTDLNEIMKQAKQMQEQFQKAQKDLANLVIEGESGAGRCLFERFGVVVRPVQMVGEIKTVPVEPAAGGDDQPRVHFVAILHVDGEDILGRGAVAGSDQAGEV